MIKVAVIDPKVIKGKIIDGFIVEREAKSGKTVYSVMFEQKELGLDAGFIGGKKQAFLTADSLETMRESVKTNKIEQGKAIPNFKIIYNETVNPPQNDDSFSVVPKIIVNAEGEKSKTEGVNVTCDGADVYRQRLIVAENSDKFDNMLPHDKDGDANVSVADLEAAASTKAKN